MHSAIFVIEVPERVSDWDQFTSQLAVKVKPGPNVDRLAENVWLVNFQKEPAALAWLVSFCERLGYAYRILQLDAAPQWLPAESDPKPS